MFVGYKILGYDPDFIIFHPESNRSLTLTYHSVKCLIEGVADITSKKGKRK